MKNREHTRFTQERITRERTARHRFSRHHREICVRKNRQGFTIVEVMIVLFILLTLAGIAVVSAQQYMDRANRGKAKLFVDGMKTPLETYYLEHGKYPESSQGLDALVTPPNDVDVSKGTWPYIQRSAIQLDPWNQPYNYQNPGTQLPEGYDLWSSGPDGVSGTDDDIGNWN